MHPEQLTAADLAAAMPAFRRAQRHDGWLPSRQRDFLRAVAAGNSITAACASVGKSAASAYAFRRTAAGAAFSEAWDAASLIARNAIGDALTNRVIDGYEETVTRPNGDVIKRRRFDNRLGLAMLTRLDEQVASSHWNNLRGTRAIAQEWESFLAIMDVPGQASAFVAERLDRKYEDSALRPLRSLERADDELRAFAEAHARAAASGEMPEDLADPLHPDEHDTAEPAQAPHEMRHEGQLHQIHPAAEDDGTPPEAPIEKRHEPQLHQLHDPAEPARAFPGLAGASPSSSVVHALAADDTIADALRETILRGLEARARGFRGSEPAAAERAPSPAAANAGFPPAPGLESTQRG